MLILILIHKYFDSKIPEKHEYNDLDLKLIAKAKKSTIQRINFVQHALTGTTLYLSPTIFPNLNN